jgi:hypothetical protein
MVGRLPAEVGPVKWEQANQADSGDCLLTTGTLTVNDHGEQLPALFIYPKHNWKRQVAIWLTDTGKDGLFGTDGKPSPGVELLLRQGYGLAALDMFEQGEFVGTGGRQAIESVRMVSALTEDDPRHGAACYTFGYNPPLVMERVHDVMALAEFLQHGEPELKTEHILLVAIGRQAGPVGLIARFMLGDRIKRAVINTEGFDFNTIDRLDDPMLLPGILRYGGMDALWMLNPPPGTVKAHGSEAAASALTAAR